MKKKCFDVVLFSPPSRMLNHYRPMDFFEEDTGVDICVVGEGEITLYDLTQRILNSNKKGLADIKGIVFKDEFTKKIKRTPLRPLAESLDDISFCDYSLVDMVSWGSQNYRKYNLPLKTASFYLSSNY